VKETDHVLLALAALDGDTQAAVILERHLLGKNPHSQGFESVLDVALAVLPERSCWELACDFAQRVLPMWKEASRDDQRPQRAVQLRRAWLAGNIGDDGLATAFEDGRTAADSVLEQGRLHAAACAAFVGADPSTNAVSAAILAAYAALDVLGEVEREWQTRRVREVLACLLPAS
jgi:hypothetical protein